MGRLKNSKPQRADSESKPSRPPFRVEIADATSTHCGRCEKQTATNRAIFIGSVGRFGKIEQVTHAIAFCLQIPQIFAGGYEIESNPFDHLDSFGFETLEFGRVVGDQSHLANSEIGQDLRTDRVVACVDRQALLGIGVDGIETVVLQRVGLNLVGDTDAPAFVAPKVDNDSPAFLRDELHR